MTNHGCAEPINHRTRVGLQRRERTRRKILEAALRVFARKGTAAPLIEEFIAKAGVFQARIGILASTWATCSPLTMTPESAWLTAPSSGKN